MPLITQIREDINTALRGGERLKLTTLRILLSVIKQREKDTEQEITDDVILGIIEKQVQLRKEAIISKINAVTIQYMGLVMAKL